jgi:hypothetical protein
MARSRTEQLKGALEQIDPQGEIVTLAVIYRYRPDPAELSLLMDWDFEALARRWGTTTPSHERLESEIGGRLGLVVSVISPDVAGEWPELFLAALETGQAVVDRDQLWPDLRLLEEEYRRRVEAERRGQLDEGTPPKLIFTHGLPPGERLEQAGDRPTIEISEIAVEILGQHGRLLSMSKTHYADAHPENEVWFNACIFAANGDEIWFGDVDLTLEDGELQQLAERIGPFYLTREQPYRFGGLPEDPEQDPKRIRRYAPPRLIADRRRARSDSDSSNPPQSRPQKPGDP